MIKHTTNTSSSTNFYSSVFPYLPSLIESFPGVKPADIGFWTGSAAAIFSLAQCVTAIPWGRASDRYGRKPAILLGLCFTMFTTLLWGFSTTLPMALFARALQGAGSGNVGILRTCVAELCPWKELQPRAFSVMPMVYSVGSVIGPMIGGNFANPLGRKAGEKASLRDEFLWKFPYVLPNLISGSLFLIGIVVGVLFLEETLDAKKDRPDYGLVAGRSIIFSVRRIVVRVKHIIWGRALYTSIPSGSSRSISKEAKDIEEVASRSKIVEGPPSWQSVLTPQTVLYLVVYAALAMHNTGFDQMISVLMHHPRSGPLVGKTNLPFQFSRGFGMNTSRIGFLFTMNGCVGTLVQFLVFPPVARYFGALNTLRIVLHLQTLVYFVTPYTTLIENEKLALTAFFLVWIFKSACAIIAFPCCTILLTNSAASMRTLGTVNGIATSVSAIGRAVGPTITGYAFTWGVKNGYLITPFVALVIIAVLAFIPLYFTSEGAGFGDDDQDASSDSEDETLADDDGTETDNLNPSKASHRLHRTKKRGSLSRDSNDTASTITSTKRSRHEPYDSLSSAIMSDSDDEDMLLSAPARDSQFLAAGDPLVSPRLPRTLPPTPSRPRRRSTTPLGDSVGFRRLSSNLGVTRSGLGSGSEL